MSHLLNKEKMIKYYENLLEKHGDNVLSLNWNSEESQELRFLMFCDIFSLAKKKKHLRILDVGCGFGDFFGYLKKEGFIKRYKIDYTGYDIVPKILEIAKGKYSEAHFELRNILEERPSYNFDYIFCSGVFNVFLMEENKHIQFVRSMLLRLWELADSGVVVNFLSIAALPFLDTENQQTNNYYYFKPEDIVSFARSLTSRFIMRHDYHVGDFTVYLLKV